MTRIEEVLLYAVSQDGDRYIFGAEARKTNPDPDAFDCSELVEWACAQAGVYIPDGSIYQFFHCRTRGTLIPLDAGFVTRGALLFKIGVSTINHVAFSLGGHRTIEARGSKWGVGLYSTVGRQWTHAGLIPDVDYEPVAPPWEVPMAVTPAYYPPLDLEPITGSCRSPSGGAWLVAGSGAVYAFGGAPYLGGANGQDYFAGRTAAQIEPTDAGYVITATSGETYVYP